MSGVVKAGLYILLLTLLAHPVGQALPRRWGKTDRLLPVTKAELRFYERLGIRRWKDILPDMSRIFPDMVPKRMHGRPTAEQIHRLMQETCIAELVHLALCLLSVGIVLLCPDRWGVLLLLIYVLLLNLPFILIQRYNRPRLQALEARLRRKEDTKK